ncbi:MAG: hypothetical protein ACC660_03710, partial [Acidimicrobiales bacterium]
MSAETGSAEAGFHEVMTASAVLEDLPDIARIEAWASSVLAVWAEAPDAADIDAEFVAWLLASSDDQAPLLLLAVSNLLGLPSEIVDTAVDRLTDPPAWTGQLGAGLATSAWSVVQGDTASVGIAFEMGDGSEHSLLGDITGDELQSLVVGPGPEELFEGVDETMLPRSVALDEAATRIVTAWEALVAAPVDVPESVLVNAAIARRRLADLTGQDLSGLLRPDRPPSEFQDQIEPAERAEFNRWAISMLDGAGVGGGITGHPLLLDPLEPARIAAYPGAEREAFAALEWADWLGVVLALTRPDPGVVVEPSMLIDQINASPEVTSTIPGSDSA